MVSGWRVPLPEDILFGSRRRGSKPEGLVRASGGILCAVRTWHNHLVPSGPSPTYATTARLLATEQLFPR